MFLFFLIVYIFGKGSDFFYKLKIIAKKYLLNIKTLPTFVAVSHKFSIENKKWDSKDCIKE
ncbi:hypothetical protein AGMMS49525_05590 [Bacteroidia bacterium]|nr:hypothetical protein AGMMS49525_05590 [Bacteroidia bacterium]